MYQAPVLALGLLLVLVYRWILLSFEGTDAEKKAFEGTEHKLKFLSKFTTAAGKVRTKIPLWLHYYVPLYIAFAYLTYCAVTNCITDLNVTGWLDPQKVRDAFAEVQGTDWEKEVDYEDSQWLRYFSLTAPVWTILCFVVCSMHTYAHVKTCMDKGSWLSDARGLLHDRRIQIIALPFVYGIMSLKSVQRMWQVSSNAHVVEGKTWEDRKEFTFKLYETNFMVADFFEAWALYQFGQLCLTVLNNNFQKQEGKLKAMEHLMDDDDDTSKSENELKLEKEMKEIEDDFKNLADSVGMLTIQGIYLFIFSCFAQAAWTITVETLRYADQMPASWEASLTPEAEKSIHYVFLGMGIIASSAAISNIVVVETTFHHRLIDFKPSPKFWGTKVLVSIAFMQSLALYLPPFNAWSPTKQNLFYASALCLECFVVSMVHLYSWGHKESWFKSIDKTKNEATDMVTSMRSRRKSGEISIDDIEKQPALNGGKTAALLQ